ncbi:MAG: hypothetical protein AAFN27_22425, partial [Pseudomonadota bacterium]
RAMTHVPILAIRWIGLTTVFRENWLSNRVFGSYDDIVALCCEAWNKLIERPWSIRSIGSREWAHGS